MFGFTLSRHSVCSEERDEGGHHGGGAEESGTGASVLVVGNTPDVESLLRGGRQCASSNSGSSCAVSVEHIALVESDLEFVILLNTEN